MKLSVSRLRAIISVSQRGLGYGWRRISCVHLASRRRFIRLLLLAAFTACVLLVGVPGVAAPPTAALSIERALDLSNQALAHQARGQWTQAETAIEQSLGLVRSQDLTDLSTLRAYAQILNTYGSLQLSLGHPEAALSTWQETNDYYRQLDDTEGQLGSQINQAQALQTLGFYRRARGLLVTVADEVQDQPDSALKATSLRSLGGVLQIVGNLQLSQQLLEQSLAMTQTLQQPEESAKTLLVLANTLRALGQPDHAQDRYAEVLTLSQNPSNRLSAQLNQLNLLIETQQWSAAAALFPDLSHQLSSLEASRLSVYSKVNFVESGLTFNQQRPSDLSVIPINAMAELLAQGVQQARVLQDPRAESAALGQLGQLYSTTQQWPAAQQVTQQAEQLAEDINASDLGYQWQAQLGKIYRQQADKRRAIAAYTSAIDTLQPIRADLLATNTELQFSFKEKIEPLYRDLVSLLLEPEDVSQTTLKQARELIEDLQLAELENYFRAACIDAEFEQIDRIDATAAIVYPIILPDRLEVILALPEQPLKHYRTYLPQSELEQSVQQLFVSFNPALSDQRRLSISKQLYDWLIKPAVPDLTAGSIKTLVFVLDGVLRSVPMTALHDGEQYLVENYAVALTPGLSLLGPHFSDPKPLQALMLGVSESIQGFSSLPGVKTELEEISANIEQAQVFLNEDFTKNAFESQVQSTPYPILHLATHGQFSSDLDNTFVLAWDQKITLGELDSLLKDRRIQAANPIELMILSACQTAEGDDRATLGLAGLALKSGARSTLATLWAVNDDSTVKLMRQFYQRLSQADSMTKAEALQKAQISLIRSDQFSHPFYWSPFVLVGNWLA